jgi:hypothetical protein
VVDVEGLEDRDLAARPGQGRVLAAGVQLQGAAALLVARHEDVVALGREHPDGGRR